MKREVRTRNKVLLSNILTEAFSIGENKNNKI